jgi:hypothetical protein
VPGRAGRGRKKGKGGREKGSEKERKEKKGRKRKKGRKGKERKGRKEKRKGKIGKEREGNREKVWKNRKIVREIWDEGFAGFSDFRRRRDFRDDGDGEVDRPAGTAACAGFPARWPTAALGRHAWVLARVRAVPAGFATRTPRVRGGNGDQGLEGGN